MATKISLRDANQRFAKLVREVESGREFVVTRRGAAVARWVVALGLIGALGLAAGSGVFREEKEPPPPPANPAAAPPPPPMAPGPPPPPGPGNNLPAPFIPNTGGAGGSGAQGGSQN